VVICQREGIRVLEAPAVIDQAGDDGALRREHGLAWQRRPEQQVAFRASVVG